MFNDELGSGQNIKDFFTKEEVETLKSIIFKEMDSREVVNDDAYQAYHPDAINIQPHFGRAVIGGIQNLIPQSIIDKATEYAKSKWPYPNKMSMTGITFMRWAKKYKGDGGDPDLEVHIDYNNNLGILLDYQLESNTKWGIAVEDSVYRMDDNEIVYFYPTTQYHWREKKQFEDSDFVDVMFFEYAGDGLPFGVRNDEKESRALIIRDRLWKESVKNV